MGGKVPTEYYLNIPAPEPKDYMESLSMMPGAKKKMKFKVDVVNSILRCVKDPFANKELFLIRVQMTGGNS